AEDRELGLVACRAKEHLERYDEGLVSEGGAAERAAVEREGFGEQRVDGERARRLGGDRLDVTSVDGLDPRPAGVWVPGDRSLFPWRVAVPSAARWTCAPMTSSTIMAAICA